MTFSPSTEQGIVLFLLTIGCVCVCVCVCVLLGADYSFLPHLGVGEMALSYPALGREVVLFFLIPACVCVCVCVCARVRARERNGSSLTSGWGS